MVNQTRCKHSRIVLQELADLRDATQTMMMFADILPEIVFHCAVQGGGIGWMKDHPVESGLDNYRIN